MIEIHPDRPLNYEDLPGPGGLARCLSRDGSKHTLIRAYLKAYGMRTFVETGTHQGETLAAVLPYVDKAISVEVEVDAYTACAKRFEGQSRVDLRLGDSAGWMLELRGELVEPALFWLDAHAGWIDDPDPRHFPLRAELEAILDPMPDLPHVILVDDARFLGHGLYPTMAEIVALAGNHSVSCDGDVVRIVP